MDERLILTDGPATEAEPGFVGWDLHGAIFRAPSEPAGLVGPVGPVGGPARMAAAMATARQLWWPGANNTIQRARFDGGSIVDGYGAKGLWHTTETANWPSYSNNVHPHITVAVVDGRFRARGHIRHDRAARALRNLVGGIQTNRGRVWQVEIVSRADIVDERGLPGVIEDGLGRYAEWLRSEWGVPMVCTVRFKTFPASFGENNGVRLSPAGWQRYRGWCGHMHAPENCVTPDTPILCADLTWRPAGDLRVGDKIIAFDAEGDGVQWHVAGSGRRFRTATILRNDPARKPCMRVTTDKHEIVASTDHPWLVRRPVGSRGRGVFAWVPTNHLIMTDKLAYFGEPWQHERTWEAGWLAGMFDADGWLSLTNMAKGAYLGIGQREGATQDRVIEAFQRRGFSPTVVRRAKHGGWNKQPFAQVSIWGLREQMRCLGTIRPPRLMDNELSVLWEGRQVRHKVSIDVHEIRDVAPVGEQEIASITTSTGTFITGGYLTHNTHGDPGRIDPAAILQGDDDMPDQRYFDREFQTLVDLLDYVINGRTPAPNRRQPTRGADAPNNVSLTELRRMLTGPTNPAVGEPSIRERLIDLASTGGGGGGPAPVVVQLSSEQLDQLAVKVAQRLAGGLFHTSFELPPGTSAGG